MFDIENHGTLVLVRPLTADVHDWLDTNVQDPQWFGSALVVEPRYVEPLVTALIEEGFAAQ